MLHGVSMNGKGGNRASSSSSSGSSRREPLKLNKEQFRVSVKLGYIDWAKKMSADTTAKGSSISSKQAMNSKEKVAVLMQNHNSKLTVDPLSQTSSIKTGVGFQDVKPSSYTVGMTDEDSSQFNLSSDSSFVFSQKSKLYQKELETIAERHSMISSNSHDLQQQANEEVETSTYINSDVSASKTTEFNFDTEPMVDQVKFNWKIKNLSNLCTPGQPFTPIRSPEFTAGEKVGKTSSWCFELRCNSGYLSLVLCHEKIRMKAKQTKDESFSNIPCHIMIFGSDGAVVQEGDATSYPSKSYPYESSYGRIQELAKRLNIFAVQRETVGWKKFMSIEELWGKKDIYLGEDDSLEFSMELDIYGVVPVKTQEELSEAHLKSITEKYQYQSKLTISKDFGENLFKIGEGQNFTIQCGMASFPVHKQIIHTRCIKFYNSLLSLQNANSKYKVPRTVSDMASSSKSTVKIPDVDADVLSGFLEYLYTAEVTNFPRDYGKWKNLLLFSVKYEARDLKKLCFLKMLELMTVDNIGGFILLANNHGASDEVKELIKGFCAINVNKIKVNEEFSKVWRHNSASFRFIESITGMSEN